MRSHWTNGKRTFASGNPISGDRFIVSMKEALFLDKAPSSVRVPLQMQNLVTFEAMTAVTLQFLQHSAQHQASVSVTPRNKGGPDGMEVDALTKKGSKRYKGKEKSKTDGQKTSCFVCWPPGQRLQAQGNELGQCDAQQQGQEKKAKTKVKARTVGGHQPIKHLGPSRLHA